MSDKKEPIVALEVAEAEFDRFVEMMDLDVDTTKMNEDDVSGFEKQKRRILRALQAGSLVINDNGEAVYCPQHSRSKHKDAITFHEYSGASGMATDGKKKNQNVAATYAMMGDMCKVHPNIFAGLVGPDIKICMALFLLLMD